MIIKRAKYLYTKFMNPKDIYEANALMLSLAKWLGVTQVDIVRKQIVTSRYGFVLKLSTAVFNFVIGVMFLSGHLRRDIAYVESFTSFVSEVIGISCITGFALTTIGVCNPTRRTSEWYSELASIDATLVAGEKNVPRDLLWKSLFMELIFFACFVPLTIIFVLATFHTEDWIQHFLLLVMYQLSYCKSSIISFLATNTVYMLYQRFEFINRRLKTMPRKRNQGTNVRLLYGGLHRELYNMTDGDAVNMNLKYLLSVYESLYELFEEASVSFSAVLGASFVSVCSEISYAAFIVIEILTNDEGIDVAYLSMYILWLLYCVFIVVCPVYVCEKCMSQARTAVQIIHEMLFYNDVPRMLKPKLISYSLQMLHQDMQFPLAGLLSFRYLFSALGTMVAYLMILLQFSKRVQNKN